MTRPVRVAVQIQPGGTPDYRTWRDAVLAALAGKRSLGARAVHPHAEEVESLPRQARRQLGATRGSRAGAGGPAMPGLISARPVSGGACSPSIWISRLATARGSCSTSVSR